MPSRSNIVPSIQLWLLLYVKQAYGRPHKTVSSNPKQKHSPIDPISTRRARRYCPLKQPHGTHMQALSECQLPPSLSGLAELFNFPQAMLAPFIQSCRSLASCPRLHPSGPDHLRNLGAGESWRTPAQQARGVLPSFLEEAYQLLRRFFSKPLT